MTPNDSLRCLSLIAVLLLLGACGITEDDEKAKAQAELAEARRVAIPVRTLPAGGGTVVETLSVQGRLEVWRQEILQVPVAGIIRKIPELPDQPVAEGDLLLLLDPPLGEDEELHKATIARDRAKRALDRVEHLAINAPVTVSTADLEGARDTMADATRELERLTGRAAKRRITAPFPGVLVRFEGLVGAAIAEGTKFAELLDHRRYRIRLEVPETTLRRLAIGQTVEIAALSDDTVAKGTVSSIPAAIDIEKGTGQVVIDTPMPPASWRPGGFASAKLVLKETTGAVVLPRSKVFFDESRAYCWLAETRDGVLVARRAWIEVGATDETRLVVTKGISAGDQVVVDGLAGMSDGVRIVIAQEETPKTDDAAATTTARESDK